MNDGLSMEHHQQLSSFCFSAVPESLPPEVHDITQTDGTADVFTVWRPTWGYGGRRRCFCFRFLPRTAKVCM